MSGIAGIIRFDGAPVDPALMGRMTAALSHRGPDGIRHWVKGQVALGQCMLCTTPESLEERQPLANEDESIVLVMDGRLDYGEDLRSELAGRGLVMRDRTDAELVLRAYEHWGPGFAGRLEGDFALVIWDARRRRALCVRDRVGNKPLHYHWDGRAFAFSSEVRPILDLPWVKRDLNEGIVAEFLAGEWYSLDETFWRGITRLVAAHRMHVSAAGPMRPERYWDPDLSQRVSFERDSDYVEHYRELISDVVGRMSRSRGPVACEVSGGLDSSAVYAVAHSSLVRGELRAPGLLGYTLDFRDDPDANEMEFSRAVGAHLGAAISEIPPTKKPLRWYQDLARRSGEFPSYPNGVMGIEIREEARAAGSRALLIGVGGDEWLGGSRTYYAEALAGRQWGDLARCAAADIADIGLPKTLVWMARHGVVPLLPEPVVGALRRTKTAVGHRGAGHIDRRAWLSAALKRELVDRAHAHREPRPEKAFRVGQLGRYAFLSDAFSALSRELEERLAAATGVELRRPFWDSRVVQFFFATPERLRRHGRVNKWMHRQAMKGLLPERVRERETKADFMVTFRRHVGDMKQLLTADIATRRSNWVTAREVELLYNSCGNPRFMGWPEWMLWSLFGCDGVC